jgi:RNA polymerase sigma-70 factor (ECF subfamily)
MVASKKKPAAGTQQFEEQWPRDTSAIADIRSNEALHPQAESPGCDLESEAVDWAALVGRVQRNDESGMAELYRLFAKGIRFYLCRQLGAQEIDDKIHDTFLIVVKAIRRGDLREPERLMGFVRTVVRRQVAAHIDHLVHRRREHVNLDVGSRLADARRDPEQNAAFRQKTALMAEVLRDMSDRDREILTRFYLREQNQDQICDQMNLSETQFRLLKSRAKARFGELGQRKLKKPPLRSILLRTSTTIKHSQD